MRNLINLLLCSGLATLHSQNQGFKKTPEFKVADFKYLSEKRLEKPGGSLPYADPSVLQAATFSPKTLTGHQLRNLKKEHTVLESDDSGFPKRFYLNVVVPRTQHTEPEFWAGQLRHIFDPAKTGSVGWMPQRDQTDELGIRHLKFQQMFEGKLVLDAGFMVHIYPNGKVLANGQFHQPEQSLETRLNIEGAVEIVKKALAQNGIAMASNQSGLSQYLKTGLHSYVLGYVQLNGAQEWKLVYEIVYLPTVITKYLLWVDAVSGEVLKLRKDQCQVHFGTNECSHHAEETTAESFGSLPDPQDAETTMARDLFDINRTIRVWREGSFQYLLDGSRPMFKPASFKLDDPVGAIWTVDGLNSNPNNIRFDNIRTNSNTWAKNAVSAHFHAGLSYEYFLNTHARNSINGKGGTILSVVNITEVGGGGMDNAFWNGEAMFYGNGATQFNSLARGLDVAGHEMSHGVIQSTANLVYENEPGAINESFADIFGAMIDRDDWKLGEDVVRLNAFPSGAMRDMSNPHNGAQTNDFGRWQPQHVSEQYRGTQDNGGVHINSGIPNHAYYLFVRELAKSGNEEQGKKTAEKIYYRALSFYLTRSSNFKDLRNAVEQACIDLHGNGSGVHNAAKLAFEQVGITGGIPGGGGQQYQNDLPVNPGSLFAVCTDDRNVGVYLINIQSSQISQLSARTIKSKPSVNDNGTEIYFVGADSRLYGLFLNQSTKLYEEVVLDTDPIYRNATISKDGRLLAVLFDQEENKIHVFDWSRQVWKTFELTNPTTSTSGGATANVRFADFLDFEHSGQYLMYDALSKLDLNSGGSYEYWDIGFLRVWNRGTNNFGDGHIEKLFSDLPENTSIGNPSFSKNSPYIIAFDYLEEDLFGNTFYILGANIENGEVGEIAANRDDTGYPNYSVDDKFIMYNGVDNAGDISIKFKQVAANKIQGTGSEQLFVSEARWGAFFANGNRVLIENTDLEHISGVEVYPVPFNRVIHLSLNSDRQQLLHLQLINSLGVDVLKETRMLVPGKNQLQLDVPELPVGMYYLKVRTGNVGKSVVLFKGGS